ncbi:uncharacterized protein LOC129732420 isoform X2 [Wyeomyia smithii]|uniref:uncharacterized protein LOC129732420 isoform X2 n=1 Tax=Wyeomyia smithii TaxID=174621 RepID=UPI002468107A|nr:uncharacterized protein LOC129732420 isoform X2 [Wyeomyia smithii]
MTEPSKALAVSTSRSDDCGYLRKLSVAGIVDKFEAVAVSDVNASSAHVCSVRPESQSLRGSWQGLGSVEISNDNNDSVAHRMTPDKEAALEMSSGGVVPMTRSGRPRQRKTAVYKGFWGDEDGQGKSGRSASGSWSSGVESDEEMVRFPCVERLIEMYANIIKKQEAETQRFMSVVMNGGDGEREGDKKRLDKTTAVGSHDKTGANAARQVQSSSTSSPVLAEQLNAGSTRIGANRSPFSDDDWSTNQQSPYCSSDEDGDQMKIKNRDKVTRSSSSDSALGLEEDISQQEQQQIINSVGKTRRLTLGVSDIPLRSALLPVPEPALLPTSDSTTIGVEHCPTVVRSKMILEAQLIELPLGNAVPLADSAGSSEALGSLSNSISRRESAQSYVSDSGVDGVRYVRTPSVVVSDYSDETMCGITLEEIEYLRRHQLRRLSIDCESDISAASSCSNLNYCGSSISALEGCDYQCGLRTPERKVSDCSTCSTLSIDEEDPALKQRLQELSIRPPGSADPELESKCRPKKKVSFCALSRRRTARKP